MRYEHLEKIEAILDANSDRLKTVNWLERQILILTYLFYKKEGYCNRSGNRFSEYEKYCEGEGQLERIVVNIYEEVVRFKYSVLDNKISYRDVTLKMKSILEDPKKGQYDVSHNEFQILYLVYREGRENNREVYTLDINQYIAKEIEEYVSYNEGEHIYILLDFYDGVKLRGDYFEKDILIEERRKKAEMLEEKITIEELDTEVFFETFVMDEESNVEPIESMAESNVISNDVEEKITIEEFEEDEEPEVLESDFFEDVFEDEEDEEEQSTIVIENIPQKGFLQRCKDWVDKIFK